MPIQWQQCNVFSIYMITAFLHKRGCFGVVSNVLKANMNLQRDRYKSQARGIDAENENPSLCYRSLWLMC